MRVIGRFTVTFDMLPKEEELKYDDDASSVNNENDNIWQKDANVYDLFNAYVYGSQILDMRDYADYEKSHIHTAIHVDINHPEKSLIQSSRKLICMDYPKTKDTDNDNDNKTKNSDEKYRKFYSYCVIDKACKNFRITTDDFDFDEFQRQFPLICPSVSEDSEMDSDRKKYPNVIIPNELYLGDMWNRNDIKCLKELGITHIVDATKDNFEKDKFEILKIALPDTPQAPIEQYFDSAIEFVQKALVNNENNRVLIHCQMGISRSTTLTIAYLMKSKKYSLYDAYKLCKECRPRIRPNDGFYQRLTQFEMKIFDGKCTTQQIDDEKLRDVNTEDCIIM